jgi:hypothetical protein
MNRKPSNYAEMTKFLETLDRCERTNIHGALIKRGWAETDEEARALMNTCGWYVVATSDDGFEPGIT